MHTEEINLMLGNKPAIIFIFKKISPEINVRHYQGQDYSHFKKHKTDFCIYFLTT